MREKIQVLDKKTKDGYPLKSLHENFFDTVVDRKDHTAIVWYEDRRKEMTYAQLKDKVLKLVEMLKKNNVSKNEYIAVLMPKGVWQIISVLAILASGCVYVPIDIDWPEERRNKICKKANIKYVICMSTVPVHAIEDVKIIYGDQSEDYQRATDIILNNIKSSAYVIFTSGTTGEPKGVEITHESAVNTIIDINERFEISSQDKCFAISSLSFDLSVYDIFGTLMAGGTIVLPRPEEQKMADRWLDIVLAEKITIWNSVPAIYEMLLMVAEAEEQILPFKKVLLSGDWVLPELFRRTKAITKHCQFIALGGATEAAIWSVYYIVNDIKEEWGAIPYGYPLANQKVMVMDLENHECQIETPGELWIGGMGVAKGYINDHDMTKEKFIIYNQERWYRTGDLVKYTNNGYLKFLGRIDHQVKLNGYRIELQEIENHILHSGYVDKNIALVTKKNGRPKLVSAIKPHLRGIDNVEYVVQPIDIVQENTSINRKESVKIFIEALLEHIKTNKIIVDKTMEPLYQLWHKRLGEMERIRHKNAENRYKEMMPLYEDILSGKKTAKELLKYPEFNPEYMVFESQDVKVFLDKIIATINKNHKSNRIGILKARTGKLIEILEQRTEGQEYILLDDSAGMLNEARKRHVKFNQYKYVFVGQGLIERQYIGTCDFVIAINALHQFSNKMDGLRMASMLLKRHGKLLIIECAKEDPMALITSYVLEAEKSWKQPNENTFFLPIDEWAKRLMKTCFSIEKAELSNADNMEYMEAVSEVDIKDVEKEIRQSIKKNLPSYMIPEEFFYFLDFPLNINGKIDRNRILKAIELHEDNISDALDLTEEEKKLAKIWKEILNIGTISKDISFFEAGGDSLLSTKLMMALRKQYGVEITLKDIFDHPYLEKMALMLKEKTAIENEYIEGEI